MAKFTAKSRITCCATVIALARALIAGSLCNASQREIASLVKRDAPAHGSSARNIARL